MAALCQPLTRIGERMSTQISDDAVLFFNDLCRTLFTRVFEPGIPEVAGQVA